MPYRFLEHVATADVAFEAIGADLEELFVSAAEATINTMLDELDTLATRTSRKIALSNTELDLLLFDYLQELIYYKDAEGLLLLPANIEVTEKGGSFLLQSTLAGEEIDPSRHEQRTDVKAVTLHRFELKRISDGWQASVILDV
jgi:SHS2 domain-containing protein